MIRLLFLLLLSGSSVLAQPSQDISWFKTLSGKIGKYPVTVLLHKAGNNYHGYYYYNTVQIPVYFTGNDTAYKGSIGLLAFASASDNELFIFKLNGNNAKGTWKKTPNSRSLSFTATAINSSIDFDYVFTEGSSKLKPSANNSPVASYSSASVWPLGNSATDEFLKNTLRTMFDDKYEGNEDIGALFLKDKKQYLAAYQRDNKDVDDDELRDMPFSYNIDQDNRSMICYLSDTIVSLAHFSYSYTGGAHGNYATSFTVVDLQKKKQLALSDIIDEKDRGNLNEVLQKNFKKQFNLKPTDSLQEGGLFENILEVNDNFYVTATGIGFSYAPYEIAPYAMGEINIFIPFTDLPASHGPTNHPSFFPARSVEDSHLSVIHHENRQY